MARAAIRAGGVLVLAMALAGCAILRFDFGDHRNVASATGAEDMLAARRALQQRRWPVAIARAEHAVALDGADGERRALLGTAYLRAGRFRSAAQAFADTLALRQVDGRTALNLALALGGAPQQGVEVLMAAMRVPGADARTRQNLALALALAGEWPDAFFLVGLDLPPAAARQRILD